MEQNLLIFYRTDGIVVKSDYTFEIQKKLIKISSHLKDFEVRILAKFSIIELKYKVTAKKN